MAAKKTPALPKDPKDLAAMVEDLQAQLVRQAEDHEAAMARRVTEEETRQAEWESQAAALQDATARSAVVAGEMADNRDRWLDRVNRAEVLVAAALDALRGIEPEPAPREDPEPTSEDEPNPG